MRKFYQRLCQVEQTIAMINLVVSTFLIFLSSVMRYIGYPLNWSLEISLFIFAWCVFLSADVALREDRMVNLDLFINRLSRRWQAYLSIFSYCVIQIFLVVVMYYGFILTYKTRVRMFHGIDFSYAWVTLSLPFAAILMSITTILKIRGLLLELHGKKATAGKQAA